MAEIAVGGLHSIGFVPGTEHLLVVSQAGRGLVRGETEGRAGVIAEGFACPAGSAVIGMKVWASSPDESADMMRTIGERIGFTVTGTVEIFDTEPTEPPRENPFGYDIQLTSFESE